MDITKHPKKNCYDGPREIVIQIGILGKLRIFSKREKQLS